MAKNFLKRFAALMAALSMLLLAGCNVENIGEEPNERKEKAAISVHFLDVGQADSILVKAPSGKNMLIDAGNNNDGEKVVSYLKSQGISKIDVLVGTHPHEDHIGGLDNVIKNFDIVNIYMPRVTSSTKTYKDVIEAVKAKNLSINTAKYGVKLDLGDGIDATMLAPIGQSYENLNDYSAVIKLKYGNTSFLFMGDAEKTSENEILNKGIDLKADVLKVGHHGSDTSTGTSFLDAVNPRYAVISVGANNVYGHPNKSTIDKLNKKGISILRTDKDGTIVLTSDGQNINVSN